MYKYIIISFYCQVKRGGLATEIVVSFVQEEVEGKVGWGRELEVIGGVLGEMWEGEGGRSRDGMDVKEIQKSSFKFEERINPDNIWLHIM